MDYKKTKEKDFDCQMRGEILKKSGKLNYKLFNVALLLGVIFLLVSSTAFAMDRDAHNDPLDILSERKLSLEQEIETLITEHKDLLNRINALALEMEALEKSNLSELQKTSFSKVAYLTFDDGPSYNTETILDTLKEYNVKATFFVVGRPESAHIYKRIVDEGHTIGLHSYSHEYSAIYTSPQAFITDIHLLKDLIEISADYTPDIIRFPGGSNNTISHRYGGSNIMTNIINETNSHGYVRFDWNVDSMDAAKGVQDKNVIVNSVINQSSVLNPAVILLHDSPHKTTTAQALPEIIEGLRDLGFEFDKITSSTPVIQFFVKGIK